MLKGKGRRRGKTRQHRRSCIENRPANKLSLDLPIDHSLRSRPAPKNSGEPSAGLELAAERIRRDFGRAIEKDQAVWRRRRPALGQGTGNDHGLCEPGGGKRRLSKAGQTGVFL